MSGQRIVFVGSKPLSAYVLAIVQMYQNADDENPTVHVQARGRWIGKAIVASHLAQKLIPLKMKDVKVEVEKFKTEKGERLVPKLTITLC